MHKTAATAVVCGVTVAAAMGAWTPPARASRIVAATVGAPFELKSDKSAKLGPSDNGLRVSNGSIVGTPAKPMVMHAVKGSDTTWIVVFAAGLPAPELPATPYAYVDGSRPMPAKTGSQIVFTGNRPNRERDSAQANPVTDAGATLGRVLFYDRRLSVNDEIACGSCHHQSMGFGDSARFSRGVGGVTKRHSMALANVRFSLGLGFFWDQRAPTLEQQVLLPIQDSIEMGMTIPDLVRKLQATDYYAPLYKAAFGTPDITPDRTARALAQFLRSMVTGNSPIDHAFRVGSPGSAALEGSRVFARNGCGLCHGMEAHTVEGAINSGLDAEPADTGAGRARFRPPSLRNIALRPPYMHDGRFKTLDEVLDFYSSQVAVTPHLDGRLRSREGARRFQLTAAEREALHAFFNALTDSVFISAPEFSNPFRK
jgi:cytochrome c peroxidase